MSNLILKGTLLNDSVAFMAIDGTGMVGEAQRKHGLSRVCTAALGRTLLITSMMGSRLKNETDRVTAVINGGGPAGNIICTAKAGGDVKGYLSNPEVELPPTPAGKLDVGGAVGHAGSLTVIRDMSLKDNYVGTCNLISGEIADDFASYFVTSEQQNTLLYLGVRVVPQTGELLSAGGLLIQPLPFCAEENIALLEASVGEFTSMTEMLENGNSLEDVLNKLLNRFEMNILESEQPAFKCDCDRHRLEVILTSLGKEELEDMLESDGGAEVKCRFCNEAYNFSADDLAHMIGKLEAKTSSEENES